MLLRAKKNFLLPNHFHLCLDWQLVKSIQVVTSLMPIIFRQVQHIFLVWCGCDASPSHPSQGDRDDVQIVRWNVLRKSNIALWLSICRRTGELGFMFPILYLVGWRDEIAGRLRRPTKCIVALYRNESNIKTIYLRC